VFHALRKVFRQKKRENTNEDPWQIQEFPGSFEREKEEAPAV
jgi:hypothetical protein